MSQRQAKYKKVYESLVHEIASGVYRQGDMIPPEKDLADKFKVSKATTSRALQLLVNEKVIERRPGLGSFVSNNPPRADRIDDTNDLLMARDGGLNIGLVVPFISTIYGNRLVAELEALCSQQNFILSIASSHAKQTKEREAILRMVDAGVDGLIVFPVNGEYYNEALLKLHVERFPLVLIDKHLEGVPDYCVSSDNKKGAYDLTAHLIQLGHREIAFITPSYGFTSSLIERLEGYRVALKEAKLPVPEEYVLSGIETVNVNDGEMDTSYVDVIKSFLQGHPQITAVVATDDAIAQNSFEAAVGIGRSVPDDLSIVCFDGPVPRINSWNFTHIIQDEVGMAKKSFEILNNLIQHGPIENEECVHIKVDTTLFEGDSTAPPPVRKMMSTTSGAPNDALSLTSANSE